MNRASDGDNRRRLFYKPFSLGATLNRPWVREPRLILPNTAEVFDVLFRRNQSVDKRALLGRKTRLMNFNPRGCGVQTFEVVDDLSPVGKLSIVSRVKPKNAARRRHR